MKQPKTLTELHTEIPNRIILNGTYFSMSTLEKDIYVILSMYKNFKTEESWVSYSTIRRHLGDLSGTRILKAIEKLNHEWHLIETWTEPIYKQNGEKSSRYKRKYRVIP